MGGPWTKPVQPQNQAKHDWSKETWKKCPIKVIQTTTRTLSLWACPVYIHTYCTLFFLLINTLFHYFLSLWEFFSAKPKGQGHVTDHWSCCCSVQLFDTPGLQHAYPSLSPRVCSDYVHWVDDAIQPSYPLFPPSPPAFNLSQHQDLF